MILLEWLQFVTHGEEVTVPVPFNFTIPEWIWIFILTVVVAGLVKYAWHEQKGRIKKIEDWREECLKHEFLTTKDHQTICATIVKTYEGDMNNTISQLKEWLGLKLDLMNNQLTNVQNEMIANRQFLDDKIENKILKELHKLNGKS